MRQVEEKKEVEGRFIPNKYQDNPKFSEWTEEALFLEVKSVKSEPLYCPFKSVLQSFVSSGLICIFGNTLCRLT